MVAENITVVIPVGPQSMYKTYLPDALESVMQQTLPPDEILIVDDQAHLDINTLWRQLNTGITGDVDSTLFYDFRGKFEYQHLSYYRTPWLSGVAHAFNFGVALSRNECVFMLGSDDKMSPTCLEECINEYENQGRAAGWYNVTIETSSGEIMTLPNNTAMITKGLWDMTGGFPVQSAVGGPDALLLSIMLRNFPGRIHQVKEGTPLCWLREHAFQATKRDAAFYHTLVIEVRNKETERWNAPDWTLG